LTKPFNSLQQLLKNMQIQISDTIRTAITNINLGVIRAQVQYEKHNHLLWIEIDKEIDRISKMHIESVKDIPQIESSREAYKALGKEPARYRLSAEALHRRIINGKGLYQISNLVDIINLASIKTGYSIGGYDAEKIEGDILFDIGRADDVYQAIGRGIMNVESLPLFRDTLGAFGSPTSDSERTMITDHTKQVLLIVINFGGHPDIETDLQMIRQLLKDYA
jgi:DNA/RNA-binding domain of Phe-tRNA-synthetase-like protein